MQVYRNNVCAESVEQYFQRLHFPYVDGLSCSLRERFNDNPLFFALLSILPLNKLIMIDEIKRLYSSDNLDSEVSLYRSSLSSEVNHECLQDLR